MALELNEAIVRDAVIADTGAGRVSWGSVWAGWAVAAGVAWLFYQLGAAIGLSAIDPAKDANVFDKSISYGAGIWILLTWMVSLFIGGWYAGRMGAGANAGNGAMHGVAVWGLTAVISIVVSFAGLAGAVKGGASILGSGVAMGASVGAQASQGNQSSTGLEAEIKQTIGQGIANNSGGNIAPQEANRAVNQIDTAALTAISGALLRGDAEGAKNLLIINTNLNRQQVESAIGSVAAQVPRYKEQIAQKAQAATRYSAALLWTMFISTLTALGLAAWGGAAGARALRANLIRQNVGY